MIPTPPDWLDGWGALLIILALAILNVWQFYRYHHTTGQLSGKLSHLLQFGHEPQAIGPDVLAEPTIIDQQPVPVGPTPEQLAAIAAAEHQLATAKAAAGLTP